MSDLTAIDILVNPDDATMAHARTWNARMRESLPDGFALDATHQPHITTVQRYVKTTELDHVYDAIERTLAGTETRTLSYEAIRGHSRRRSARFSRRRRSRPGHSRTEK